MVSSRDYFFEMNQNISIDPTAIARHNRATILNQRLSQTMTPKEYCEKWVAPQFPVDPKTGKRKRGYRAECIRQLSKATKISESRIKNWGSELDGYSKDKAELDRLSHVLTLANFFREAIELGKKIFENE